MNGPLEFLHIFVKRLREAHIRFAITSGMACVHYELLHQLVMNASATYALPEKPIQDEEHRCRLYELGVQRAAALTSASPSELRVQPPIEIILP